MGGRYRNNHGRLGQWDITDPVKQNDPTEIRPTLASRSGDLIEPGYHLLFVGLVLQPGYAVAADRMVSGRTGKHHNSTARRLHNPFGCFGGR